MSEETTTGKSETLGGESPSSVGDFAPPGLPRGKLSLVRIYTGVFLLLFIPLVWVAAPNAVGAVVAFLTFGLSAYHVLFRRAFFWRPARPNPFRRRAMTGLAALGAAAAAALVIALPGAAVIGLIWAIFAGLVALQNRIDIGVAYAAPVYGLLVIAGAVAAPYSSYLVARRLFPADKDA
jgi:hypothetical protein